MSAEQSHPLSWYRTMDHRFATNRFGFPDHPGKGQQWTAFDGSAWTFDLTGTGNWELASYPPDSHPERPAHGFPPPEGEPGQPGYVVGYIAELDDDTEGPQLMAWSGAVHETWEDAHTVWKKAQNWRPGWRLYSLTDMTEKPKRRRVDIENENAELDQIRERLLKQRDAYRRALSQVFAEHQPMVVETLGGPGLQLRCRRCHTDEHHTVMHDNHMLWPCPTIAPFVTFAAPTSPEPTTDQE